MVTIAALLIILCGLPVWSCSPTPEQTQISLDSDGDGWPDTQEQIAGTNPYNKDTDNDGHWDSKDPNPLDPRVPTSATPAPAPSPAPTPSPSPTPSPNPPQTPEPPAPVPAATDQGVKGQALRIEDLPIRKELSPREAEN